MSRSTEPITIHAAKEIVSGLDALAAAMDRSRDDVVNQALRQYLETNAWQIGRIEEGRAAARAVEPLDQLLRKGEDAYKEANLADTSLSDQQLIDAMVTHPRLIERPIVLHGDKAALGRPPENVLEIL